MFAKYICTQKKVKNISDLYTKAMINEDELNIPKNNMNVNARMYLYNNL